jgi:DNA/RNA-binding domain of Phe-tRNA-synthetase-like protein
LTAGHDLDTLSLPLRLDVARGNERYELLNGAEQACKPGDIVMSDAHAAICSILLGPDARTSIRPTTRRVLFVVYGVPGVAADAVRRHLADIDGLVRLVTPAASDAEVSTFAVASVP